jgi:hypothetical protein
MTVFIARRNSESGYNNLCVGSLEDAFHCEAMLTVTLGQLSQLCEIFPILVKAEDQ